MLRTLGVVVISFVLLGGFMALDRLALHWYVPDAADLRGGLPSQAQGAALAYHQLNQDARIDRLAEVLALRAVGEYLIPGADSGHPQVEACKRWLLSERHNEGTGEAVSVTGSAADCGLRLTDER